MTKVAGTPKSGGSTPNLKKHGGVQKNKTPKFKQTPTGKVALINGKTPNKNTPNKNSPNKNQKTPKGTPRPESNGNGVPKTPKSGKKGLPVISKIEEVSSKEEIDIKKLSTPKPETSPKKPVSEKKSTQEKEVSPKKQLSKKKKLDLSGEKKDESINEGITLPTDDSDDSDEDVDDDDSDVELPNILGQSLNEESDDDDDDFDESVESDENKGVKMFKGIKKAGEESNDDDDSDDDDDSSENSALGLKALLGDSLKDDDDDDDDDESDEEESALGLKALLEDSLKDDDDDDEDFKGAEDDDDDDDSPMEEDDEDFEEGSDDEGSDEIKSPESKKKAQKEKKAKKSLNESTDSKSSHEGKEERNKRSIFVGNVPKTASKQSIQVLFKKFGEIESIRIRGVVPENPNIPLKVAAIKKKIHPKMTTVSMFVVFKKPESVIKALELNGHKFMDHYLRVDSAISSAPVREMKKAVFLGNLPFECDDNSIWNLFLECGPIESVRVVRDRHSGLNRGIGYVNFKNEDSVALALQLDGSKIKTREIRVQPCSDSKKKGKKRSLSVSSVDKSKSPKKQKDAEGNSVNVATHNSKNAEKRKKQKMRKRSQGEAKRGKDSPTTPQKEKFQGQKADKKKKQKLNKTEQKKKTMAAKLAAKPNKKSD